jgi:hypothetical protein
VTNMCGKCPATWSGAVMCHCRSCHQTFSTPSNFDKHRAGSKNGEFKVGECSLPSLRGLVLNGRGYWAAPGRDEVTE